MTQEIFWTLGSVASVISSTLGVYVLLRSRRLERREDKLEERETVLEDEVDALEEDMLHARP